MVASFFYPPKLIEETITVFKEEDGMVISPETAIEYLDNLSGLFLAFSGRDSQDAASAADASAPLT